MTLAVPLTVLPWKVTEQLPADRRQLEALRVPPVVPADSVKVTVLVGVFAGVVVSETVAVQVEVAPIAILFGLQRTAVEVLSLFTVIVFDVPAGLALWFASPPYVPLTVAVPAPTPVKVTVQVPDAPRVQLAPTVPTAVLDDVKLTEPVAILEAVVVSVTVAVQVEVPPIAIDTGVHETAVEVLSLFTVIVFEAVGPLPLWFASPPYVPLTVAVPAPTPVKVTVQVPDAPRVQLAPTVPTATLDDVKLTEPVAILEAVVVSVTVAVQVDVPPMLIEAGEHDTAVVVLSLFTVIEAAALVLVAWVASPP